MAEAIVAVMETRDIPKKAEQAKELERAQEDFQASQW